MCILADSEFRGWSIWDQLLTLPHGCVGNRVSAATLCLNQGNPFSPFCFFLSRCLVCSGDAALPPRGCEPFSVPFTAIGGSRTVCLFARSVSVVPSYDRMSVFVFIRPTSGWVLFSFLPLTTIRVKCTPVVLGGVC